MLSLIITATLRGGAIAILSLQMKKQKLKTGCFLPIITSLPLGPGKLVVPKVQSSTWGLLGQQISNMLSLQSFVSMSLIHTYGFKSALNI